MKIKIKIKIIIATIFVILLACFSLIFVYKKQLIDIFSNKSTRSVLEGNSDYNLEIRENFGNEKTFENEVLIFDSENLALHKDESYNGMTSKLEEYLFKDEDFAYERNNKCYMEENIFENKKKLDAKNSKNIQVTNCYWVSRIDKYKENYYVAISGRKMEKAKNTIFKSTGPGLFRLVVLNANNDKFSIIADSDYIEAGSLGKPPFFYKTFEVGKNKRIAWMVAYEKHNLEVSKEFLHIYFPFDKNIVALYQGKVSTNNNDKCAKDNCGIRNISNKIKTIISDSNFYPLKFEKLESTLKKGEVSKEYTKYVFEFYEKNLKYMDLYEIAKQEEEDEIEANGERAETEKELNKEETLGDGEDGNAQVLGNGEEGENKVGEQDDGVAQENKKDLMAGIENNDQEEDGADKDYEAAEGEANKKDETIGKIEKTAKMVEKTHF